MHDVILNTPPPAVADSMIKVGALCIPEQVCLLSRYSLVLTFVVCIEIEEEQPYPFRVRGD